MRISSFMRSKSLIRIESDAFTQVVVLVAFFKISRLLDTRDHFHFLISQGEVEKVEIFFHAIGIFRFRNRNKITLHSTISIQPAPASCHIFRRF